MRPVDFPELAASILARPCAHAVRLVAVDGPGGAGKSTFAERLAPELTAPIVPLDDFLAWDDLYDFWPRLEEQVLCPLFLGQSVRYQQRDWVSDVTGRALGEWREVPASPCVVLEGVGASRRELESRLTYSVWVETPATLRLARGLARDQALPRAEALWRAFQREEERLFERDHTRERAHLVVGGTSPPDTQELGFGLLEERNRP